MRITGLSCPTASHPPKLYSKQIKYKKSCYREISENRYFYQICGGKITSSALEAITEEGRLTDSNIYALVSSVGESIIKPK